nr:MAG TPA: hypothetical protein [Ackermannviridae sp.]
MIRDCGGWLMRKSGHPPQHIKTTKETQEQINNK